MGNYLQMAGGILRLMSLLHEVPQETPSLVKDGGDPTSGRHMHHVLVFTVDTVEV